MESVHFAAINKNISLNQGEEHCVNKIINETAGKSDTLARASIELFLEDFEEVSECDFNGFDTLEENEIVTKEEGSIEKNNFKSVEITSIGIIASHEEKLKNFVVFDASTPSEAKKAIESGNFKNITDLDGQDFNLTNRAFLDHEKHEIVVPTGSLLELGSEHMINGVKYTVRLETHDEREKFENNWSTYKDALNNEAKSKNKNSSDEGQNKTKNVANNNQETDPNKGFNTDGVNQISKNGISNKEANIGVLTAIMKKHGIEKKWLFEEITKEDLLKEIGKKNLNKDSINCDMINRLIIAGSSLFIFLNTL